MKVFQALQLGDSFFPVGTFAFSQGLESLVQDGLVTDVDSLADYLRMLLEQVAWTDGIGLLHACAATRRLDAKTLVAIDREVWARKLGSEARSMSAKTGRQMLLTGVALWPEELRLVARLAEATELVPTYAVAVGCVATAAGLSPVEAFVLNLYTTAAGICGAALRLLRVVDHVQTQQLLLQAQHWSGDLVTACADQPLDAMRTSTPVLEIAGMRHERAFVRLFAS